jgi:SAM-dependent methyltransferase
LPREAPPDAFGRTAREYELGRPLWPEELLDRVIGELGLGGGAVLDLGAGTGKLTRALVPRFSHVVAVEPDEAMLEVLEEVVPEADARSGSGQAIPLEDGSVDAVFSAEAFHWFASDESVAEIVRVLRPRGALVILWNIGLEYDDMGEEAEAVIQETIERGGEPGIGRVLSGGWRVPIERAAFEELRETDVHRDIVNSRDEWIANMLSVSSIAHQPDEDRLAFAERMRELVPPDRKIARRVRTVAYWTRLV